MWVLTRDPTYPDHIKELVRCQLALLGINQGLLTKTDQNCVTESVNYKPSLVSVAGEIIGNIDIEKPIVG